MTRRATTEPVNSLNEPRPAAFPATAMRKTVTMAARQPMATYGTGYAVLSGGRRRPRLGGPGLRGARLRP
jgi:hypothetical protein